MACLRRLWRLSLLALWFFVMTFYALLTCVGGWRATQAQTRKAKVWARGIARIIGLRVRVHGDPEAVSGLVVSNHLSYMDILTLGSVFPLRFTPKSDIRAWPFLGWFIILSRPIWVDRNSRQSAARTGEEVEATLRHGMNLAVFPEGTSGDGEGELLPFKSAVFEAAVRGGFDIQPALIRYHEDFTGQVAWFGDATLLPHVWRLLGLPRVEADLYVLPPLRPEGRDRKALSEHVRGIMNARYLELGASNGG